MHQLVVTATEADPIYRELRELVQKHFGTGGTCSLTEVPDRPTPLRPGGAMAAPDQRIPGEDDAHLAVGHLRAELEESPLAQKYLDVLVRFCVENETNSFTFEDL